MTIAGRSADIYLLCVYAGAVVGNAVIFGLSAQSHLSLSVTAILVALVAVLSLALYKSTKLRRTYPLIRWAKRGVYHYQIVAVIFTVAVLRVLGEPVLPYLDILVVGLIVYQAFGRVGCLMAGCCHGRPSSFGVRYGREHVATGYVYFVQGVRLFPVQLFESLVLVLLAAGALFIFYQSDQPGEIVAFYIVGYGIGRFALEFMRGDAGRLHFAGFSEPQWTALGLTVAVVTLELAGILPFHRWHAGALLLMTSAVGILVIVGRVRTGEFTAVTQVSEVDLVHRAEHSVLTELNLLPVSASDWSHPGAELSGMYVPRRIHRLTDPPSTA
jgi:hypothetical protein